MLVDEYQVTFWTRGQYPAAPPQTLFIFTEKDMTEHHLGRGYVLEYDTPAYPGFVRDGESNFQLPFYYRDGRFLVPHYERGEPSFSESNEIIQDNRLFVLREPRVNDEIVYRLMGQGAMAQVFRWTYASHYDAMRLSTEKPA